MKYDYPKHIGYRYRASACFLAKRGFKVGAIDLIIDQLLPTGHRRRQIAAQTRRLCSDLHRHVRQHKISTPKKTCIAPQPDLGNFSRFD
jgi:hypothetical protein